MNEETSKLLQQLASKLGTTTEYLWGVLINQAHISASIQLIQTAILFILAFVFYRFHLKFDKQVKTEGSTYTHSIYEENDSTGVIMTILGIVLAIFIIVDLCYIDNIINGFFNPEYWALNKIISTANGR